MKNVIALVLGGGRGTRLFPLTSIRSKPAVPLGGMYRLIDIPISNCINSGVNQIFVLTQFMSNSLHQHIRGTYNFDHFSQGFVEILAAQETMEEGSDWYQGTADAVRKNLRNFEHRDTEYVLILSGDQLYRMDFAAMLAEHQRTKADVSIACMPVSEEDAKAFGVMRMDDQGRVQGFLEKPQTAEEMNLVRTDPELLRTRGFMDEKRNVMASMGIYIFNKSVLTKVLTKTAYRDFGKEVFPATIRSHRVQSFWFDGYWEDIGTIKSFYEANLSLAAEQPPFDLAHRDQVVYTRARFLPPTRIGNSRISNSLIANGCRIGDNVTIENSIIGLRTIIGDGAVIKDSILMGADYYENDVECERRRESGTPTIGIGDNTVIRGAIIDKNCCIGSGAIVNNEKQVQETPLNHPQFVIRDGIPVLIKDSVLPSGWKLGDHI
ncbi:MAG: glucose-1-phosphate adenylyltransferase [Pirellulaceae bacterium]